MLRTVPYEPRFLPDLTRLVNQHLMLVPSGLPLTAAQVSSALDEEPFWDRHYEDDGDTRVRHRDTLCVLHGDRLIAAAGVHWLERGGSR